MQDRKQNNNLQIYGHQVSGKAPKFIDKTSKFIYKKYSQNEANFYLYLNSKDTTHCSYHLRKYIPQFKGIYTQSQIFETNHLVNEPNQNLEVNQIVKESLQTVETTNQRKQWIEHINCRSNFQADQKFIKLKNLTQNFRYPNVIDLKLGIKSKTKSLTKYISNTTLSHKFRINGLSIRQFDEQSPQGIQRFMSKYYCQQISSEEICSHLGFFLFNGKNIHLGLLDKIIFQLKEIVLAFRSFRGINFMSSSLYIAYDAYDINRFTINFIDFDKYSQSELIDNTVEQGLINCLKFFITLKQQVQSIAHKLMNKQFKYFNASHQVIPQHIKNKYQ